MVLAEYVSRKSSEMLKGRNIILTDKVSYANSLLRKLNVSGHIDVFNTEPKTLKDIASEIVRGYCLALPEEGEYTILTKRAQSHVLEGLLVKLSKEGNLATISNSSLSTATAREILACITELRMNDVTEKWEKSTDAKVADIKLIMREFEDYVAKNREYDEAGILLAAIDILERLPVKTASGTEITAAYLIPWANECNLGVISDYKRSILEERFIGALIKAADAKRFDIEIDHSQELTKGEMYGSYGLANEVRHIASVIKDDDVSYGDIQVFYSNPVYLNYIKATFDSNNIPYVLTNGYSAEELDITQFMLSLIDSARDDFSYELLKDAVINRKMTFENVTPDKTDSVFINPIRPYNNVLNYGIGWGRKRYADYRVKAEEEYEQACKEYDEAVASGDEDETALCLRRRKIKLGNRYLAEFMVEFTECFAEDKSCEKMLFDLWRLCSRYTREKNPERKKLKESIFQEIVDLRYLDEKMIGMGFEDRLDVLEDFLRDLTVSDDADPAAVAVSMINGIQVIERSHVFVIGLSAGQFNLDTKQSPILLDDEKKEYLAGAGEEDSPVVLSGERNSVRRKELFMTLSSADDADLTFIYNYYDTTGQKDSSPSVFFMEVADKLGVKEFKKTRGYDTVDKDVFIESKKLRSLLKDGIKEDDPETVPARVKTISATGMQNFLSCPLKYYYNKIKYLRVYDQKVKSGHQWLGAFGKGNLLHYTAEKYFSEHMPRKAGYDSPKVDEAALRDIVREMALQIEEVEPFISTVVRKREEDEYYEKILEYISFVTEHWDEEHPWVVIGCEIGFEDVTYSGCDKDHPVELTFNGSIDRMDGYLEKSEEGENILHIRILDYKSGKQSSKEEEVESGVQVQHFIYSIAAIEYLKNNTEHLQDVFETDSIDRYSLDFVGYEFPYDENSEVGYTYDTTPELSDVEDNVLEGGIDELKVDFKKRVVDSLDSIIGAYQHDEIEELPRLCREYIEETIDTKREEILQNENAKIIEKANTDYLKKYNAALEKEKKAGLDEEEAAKKAKEKVKKEDPVLLTKEDIRDKYGLKEFCKYCDYTDICRMYVGGTDL